MYRKVNLPTKPCALYPLPGRRMNPSLGLGGGCPAADAPRKGIQGAWLPKPVNRPL